MSRYHRRRASSRSFWRTLVIIGAGAVALALVLMALSIAPSDRLMAFEHAPACDTPPPQPTPACRYSAPLTVTGVRRWGVRSGVYYDFRLSGGGATFFTRTDCFFWSCPRDVHSGQPVRATVWDGAVTTLMAGGQSYVTHDSPLHQPMDERRVAISLTVLGLLLLGGAWAHHRWTLRKTK
jgi:hypothetical protein